MTKQEQLYETLGELLYVIAKADGVIQFDEIDALNELLADHPWASTIKWSFDYEETKGSDIESLYKKVINHCQSYGPSAEYLEFIDAMNHIALASRGIEESESKLINSFSRDLIDRFVEDIARIK